ncbi:hypothetical protein P8605_18630 [Streptomyces sp. T-3]|nr:hypothetical protein [Streptomyces sp. T-3]
MARPAILSVRITADASRAQRGAAQAQRAFGSLASTVKKAAVAAGALALGGGLVDFARTAVTAASEVEQNYGALDAVFKGNAATMKRWSDQASQSVGLSKREYSGLAVTLGASLKNQGVALKDVGGLTNDLITKGADLASMFGGTTAEAVDALAAAFRGEADPAERYGLNLSQTAVNAYKAAHASEKLTDTQARLRLITEQSKDATGNFAREANTLSGQQQRLSAQWDNMAASVGAKVLPALTSLASWANSTLLPALASLAMWLRDNVGPALVALGEWINTTALPALQALGGWIVGTLVPSLISFAQWVAKTASDWLPLIAAIGAFVLVLAGPYIAAMITANAQGLLWIARMGLQAAALGVVTVATNVWAAAQRVLNLVLSMNPIGLVIAALVAIAVAIYTAYQRSDTFRAICQKVWQVILGTGRAIGGAFVSAWNACKRAVGWVVDKVRSVISWFGRIKFPNPLDAIKRGFDRIKQAAQWVIDKVRSVINWLKRIPGGGILSKVLGKFSANSAARAPKSSRYGLYASGPAARAGLSLTGAQLAPRTEVHVTIDGQQLQGRITKVVHRAMGDDGARFMAGGWA